MFPGCSATELFNRWEDGSPLPEVHREEHASRLAGQTAEVPRRAAYADLVAAYASRAEFAEQMPPHTLFDPAKTIQAAGLSLNMLCQHYSDQRMRALLARGARLECLFLDPDGESMRAREAEENYTPGDLSSLTHLNMQLLGRLRDELPADDRDQVDIRTYDQCIRFNITIVDGVHCIAQPYLPAVRGVDPPTLVMRRRGDGVGMFATFQRVFTALWDGATACA